MNTKTLSSRALSVIDQYLHFSIGSAVCSVPYFNNKTSRLRVSLRAYIGKGSPKDIYDEVSTLMIKNHISLDVLADESLKKLMTDSNIGIDCSGLAYYILNAESEDRGKQSLSSHISFVNQSGMLGKIRAKLRPAENCDVVTFADNKNSSVISLRDVQPGDMITMTSALNGSERDHVLVIHQIEYQNFVPMIVYYTHAVAYPEDGVYETGLRQGKIEIIDANKNIIEGVWSENGSVAGASRIFNRAKLSKTELRRLNWL